MPSAVSDRGTFRVALTDGRVVKARRHSRVATARRYAGIVRALPDLPFAPVLARHGRVTIEAWVPGVPLSRRPRSRARVAAAAAILRALHGVRRLGRRRLAPRASTRAFAADLVRRLDVLVAARALTTRDADRVRRALARTRPATARVGVIHNDFSAENVVEDRSGRLHVVDSGGIRVGFLDLDLARTWYRWPMPAATWRAFLATYAGSHGVDPETPAPFWRLAALVRSAHFRVVRATPAADVPLRRLRRLIGRRARS